jgi:hypothetical protein
MSDQAARRSDDIAAADWVVGRLASDSYRVDMLLPDGFAAYVRVLHAIVLETDHGRQLIRWRDVAAAAGLTELDRCVQFATLASHPEVDAGNPPLPGELPDEQLATLTAVLANHTATPKRCWFCVWNGYGEPADRTPGSAGERTGLFTHPAEPPTRPASIREADRGATVRGVLERRYHLYTGPLGAVTTLGLPANLWWPEDHAWCVASDVDLDSTYIGGSEALARALIHHPRLEALPAQLHDPITRRRLPSEPASELV